MAEPIIVVGAGGFGREVLDVIDAINESSPVAVWRVVGVADDSPSEQNLKLLERRGVDYVGSSESILHWATTTRYAVGIGKPQTRRAVADKLDHAGYTAATLIHPSVSRGFGVQIGEGSILCAGVRLTTNIGLGRHVHLNLNATVGHDSRLGDFVSVNPLGSISGDCSIGDDVLIGVSGVVLNGLRVGSGAVIGGSACVVSDVPEDTLVKGVPAR